MSTWEVPPRRKAIVHTGSGVQINYGQYWCAEMADTAVEKTAVPVRYDDDNVTQAAAFIGGEWPLCLAKVPALEGCSIRELHLLAAQYRQQRRLAHGARQVALTQEHLALFRRENASVEAILMRQRKDAEMRTASHILGGGSVDLTPQVASKLTDSSARVRSLSSGPQQAAGDTGATGGGEEGQATESAGLPVSSLEASSIHLIVFPRSR